MGQALVSAAQQAFVEAMSITTVMGAVIAFGGVLVAVIWMPHRPTDHAQQLAATGSAGPRVGLALSGDQDSGEHRGYHARADAQPDGAVQ